MLQPISNFMSLTSTYKEIKPETPLIRYLEILLNRSENLKGLNLDYIAPLKELKETGKEKLSDAAINQ